MPSSWSPVPLTAALRPGAHLRRAGHRLESGGANTPIALAAAGHQVALLCVGRQDWNGDALLKELDSVQPATAPDDIVEERQRNRRSQLALRTTVFVRADEQRRD